MLHIKILGLNQKSWSLTHHLKLWWVPLPDELLVPKGHPQKQFLTWFGKLRTILIDLPFSLRVSFCTLWLQLLHLCFHFQLDLWTLFLRRSRHLCWATRISFRSFARLRVGFRSNRSWIRSGARRCCLARCRYRDRSCHWTWKDQGSWLWFDGQAQACRLRHEYQGPLFLRCQQSCLIWAPEASQECFVSSACEKRFSSTMGAPWFAQELVSSCHRSWICWEWGLWTLATGFLLQLSSNSAQFYLSKGGCRSTHLS